jgi:hypothetical protein
VVVSDGTLRSALVNLQPGQLYYFRVCKYNAGCVAYSPVFTFTPAAAAVEGGFTLTQVSNVTPAVEISWVINTDSPNGYKILWSTAPLPVPDDAFKGYVASPTTYNYMDPNILEGTVNIKVCRWSGAWCLSYSDTLTINVIP